MKGAAKVCVEVGCDRTVKREGSRCVPHHRRHFADQGAKPTGVEATAMTKDEWRSQQAAAPDPPTVVSPRRGSW
jgi:hypothetical protein